MQQTATGLALDLGLHEKSRRRVMDFPGQPSLAQLSVAEQCERQRTFLGCYYLSSMYVSLLHVPVPELNSLGSLVGYESLIS